MGNFVYLIGDAQTREVALVDPAWQIDTIAKIIQTEELKLTAALVTHCHFDHCNGIEELLNRWDVPIYVHKKEIEFTQKLRHANQLFSGFPKKETRGVDSGDKLSVGGIEITFLHTPGHTPGSQCFLVEDKLVSGDTLFIRGCGRTDLPGGDPEAMYNSLTQKLMKLPEDTLLLPGHNYSDNASSPLIIEKKENPYLICDNLDTFLGLVGRPKNREKIL